MTLTEKKRRVVLEPQDPEARYALAEAYFADDQLEAAHKQLSVALQLSPEHGNAGRLLLRVKERLGQQPDLSKPEAWSEAARRFARQGRLDDAILYGEAACLRGGEDVPAWLELADWCGRRRLWDRALLAYGAALRLSQREPRVVEARDALLSKLGLSGIDALSEAPEGALSVAARALVDGDVPAAKRALMLGVKDPGHAALERALRAEIARAEGQPARAVPQGPFVGSAKPHGTLGAGVIGVLGWSPIGGAVSPLEAAAVIGSGQLRFTGNVGDSGREAGLVAHTCLKAMAEVLGIGALVGARDLHLHFTDIELGKDGVSSGLALTLAGAAAFKNQRLAPRLGATGAITLHGEVQRVDGIYEKLVAARLAGLRRVIFPRENREDIEQLPALVRANIELRPVTHLEEALSLALAEPSRE